MGAPHPHHEVQGAREEEVLRGPRRDDPDVQGEHEAKAPGQVQGQQ